MRRKSNITIASVDGYIILNAIEAEWDDFEDCVQHFTGESIEADLIVTRNPSDFSKGTIETLLPIDLLDLIAPDKC